MSSMAVSLSTIGMFGGCDVAMAFSLSSFLIFILVT